MLEASIAIFFPFKSSKEICCFTKRSVNFTPIRLVPYFTLNKLFFHKTYKGLGNFICMKYKNLFAILVITAVLFMSACTQTESKVVIPNNPTPNNPTSEVVNTPPSPDTTAVKEFIVKGSNYKFESATLNVKKGDRVKIILDNVEGFHDLKIDEFGVATKKINGGETDSIEFVADKVGTFEYYCSVGQHRSMA